MSGVQIDPMTIVFFIVLAILLVLAIAISMGMRFRLGISERWQDWREKRRPKISTGRSSSEPVRETPSMSVKEKDLFNLTGDRRGRSASEKEIPFSKTYSEVNQLLNDRTNDPALLARLFKVLDEEHLKLHSHYIETNDKGAQLHLEQNYLWLKYRQSENGDPTESFLILLQSLGKVLDRHAAKSYPSDEYRIIIDRYRGTISSLYNNPRTVDFNRCMVSFSSFCFLHSQQLVGEKGIEGRLTANKIVDSIIRFFLDKHFLPIAKTGMLRELKGEHIQSMVNQVEYLKRTEDTAGTGDPYVLFLCHSTVCRLRMALARELSSLEPSSGRFQEMRWSQLRRMTSSISEDAQKAADSATSASERYASDLGGGVRTIKAESEIVLLLAGHYRSTYGDRDVLEAWNSMEKVKAASIRRVLNDDVSISEDLLQSCEEEWSVLNRRTREWSSEPRGKDAFGSPGAALFSTADLDLKGKSVLAILSSIQGEGVPADLVVDVTSDLAKMVAIRSIPVEVQPLVRGLRDNMDDREKSFVAKGWNGLQAGKKCLLLQKGGGAALEEDILTSMIQEAYDQGTRDIYIVINFSRDLGSMEHGRRYRAACRSKFPRARVHVIDAKSLVSTSMDLLRRNGATRTYSFGPGMDA